MEVALNSFKDIRKLCVGDFRLLAIISPLQESVNVKKKKKLYYKTGPNRPQSQATPINVLSFLVNLPIVMLFALHDITLMVVVTALSC